VSLDTPVVFVIFNRPDLAARVLAAIAQARPKQLLVVSDGPRRDRPGEAERVAATRSLVERVDWPCEVLTDYADVNLGCRRRITSGLDWAFKWVEELILLEEDCLPHPTFFAFCRELLHHYRDDPRVLAVRGCTVLGGHLRTEYGYRFSKHFSSWGTALWRRVWLEFDPEMRSWPEFLAAGGMHAVADSPEEEAYFSQVFDNTYRGLIDSWVFPMQYHCWSRQGLIAASDRNLIANIGCGEGATNTSDAARLGDARLEAAGPLKHPHFVLRHKEADADAFRVAHGLDLRSAESGGGSPDEAITRMKTQIHQLEMRVIHQDIQLDEKEAVIQQQHKNMMRLLRTVHPARALAGGVSRWLRRLFDGFKGASRRLASRPIPVRLRPLIHARKVILGAGPTYLPGWYSTDQDVLDVRRREDFARFWSPNSRTAFLAEHVWEHLTRDEADRALAHCYEFLEPGGWLRIAVPDGLHPDPAYRDAVRPGGSSPGADDHKVRYDHRLLSDRLQQAGFEVQLLEYWDEQGQFHRHDWSSEDGHIQRSACHDHRNRDRPLSYTSLIVDAVKPRA
jgi:predicted SAM-dependent methyltransferase